MSSTKETADKLELADKEAIDAELQVGALKRRLALLEEEAARNKAKLQVSNEKHYALFCTVFEDTNASFRKTLKNVTMPNLPPPRTKKVDVLVKPAHSLLNKVSKLWNLNLKKLNPLPPQPTTNSKMLKESARSLKVILNVSLNVPKNSKAKHVTSKPKSAKWKAKSRKLKPSLSR